ncbi:MAG: proteasome accessory factor PafA2 family protein [Vicinamibacterales bacterium]
MQVPKIVGADVELGNFLLGPTNIFTTGAIASRLLLDEFDGVPDQRSMSGRASEPVAYVGDWGNGSARSTWGGHVHSTRDWGRKYLPTTGGCAYIDSNHLELALCECRDAWSHVASFHAMLGLAQRAQRKAGAKLPEGVTLEVLANSSDGLGQSYGAHLDFLVSRQVFDDLLDRKSHYLGWLASFQVSAMVLSGQGKVGAENGARSVGYQISQRADFFDRVSSLDTMAQRGIVNRRREPLCGGHPGLGRLHVICFDNMLMDVARLVTVGAMQIALSMLEAGCLNPALILESPVDALHEWSADPSLRTTARLVGGRQLTIVELQRAYFEDAARFVASGRCMDHVVRADDVLTQWGAVLDALESGDVDGLATKLDWVAKYRLLQRVMSRHPHLTWEDAELKALDHAYASLGDDGWLVGEQTAGRLARVVSASEISRASFEPPDDTRAWARTQLLRRFGEQAVKVDWDSLEFEVGGRWSQRRFVVVLDDPAGFTRAQCGAEVEAATDLEAAVRAVDAVREDTAHNKEDTWTRNANIGRLS